MVDAPLSLMAVLARHGVPFVVIGGHAVGVHGYPRATQDTDIVFARSPETEKALLAALHELHAVWISNEKDPATGWERHVPVTLAYIQGHPIMWLMTDLGFLDIMDHIPGLPGATAKQLIAESIEINGLLYASRPWLIRMKKAAGRTKDLMDIEELEKD